MVVEFSVVSFRYSSSMLLSIAKNTRRHCGSVPPDERQGDGDGGGDGDAATKGGTGILDCIVPPLGVLSLPLCLRDWCVGRNDLPRDCTLLTPWKLLLIFHFFGVPVNKCLSSTLVALCFVSNVWMDEPMVEFSRLTL